MEIDVLPLGEHEWSAAVRESTHAEPTYHRIKIDPETDITLGVTDEQALVREAVATYLDHEPATSLPRDFDIDWLEQHVPDFVDELTARLS